MISTFALSLVCAYHLRGQIKHISCLRSSAHRYIKSLKQVVTLCSFNEMKVLQLLIAMCCRCCRTYSWWTGYYGEGDDLDGDDFSTGKKLS